MTARWDRLPEHLRDRAKEPKRRGARTAGTFRCAGPRGCGEVTVGSYGTAEKHADTHGGARIEVVLPEREDGP